MFDVKARARRRVAGANSGRPQKRSGQRSTRASVAGDAGRRRAAVAAATWVATPRVS